MKYEIVIYWSNEDNCYVALAPELKGCMAHGTSYAECVKEIETAMENWLEAAKEFGKQIPEPKGELVKI